MLTIGVNAVLQQVNLSFVVSAFCIRVLVSVSDTPLLASSLQKHQKMVQAIGLFP